jgi:hypothetical protein
VVYTQGVAMSMSEHKTRPVFECYNVTNVTDWWDTLLETEKYQAQGGTEGKTVVTIQQGLMTLHTLSKKTWKMSRGQHTGQSLHQSS